MHNTSSTIHPTLRKDCFVLGRFSLSYLLLMNDSHYPWCILVPDRDAVTEIFHLNESDRQQLSKESNLLTETMSRLFNADKMNIAALGNIVPQLHIHHVARFRSDTAWPAPVWGVAKAAPYSTNEFVSMREQLCAALNDKQGGTLGFTTIDKE